MNNRPMSLMIGGTLGIFGALLAWNYAIIGVPMIIGAAALVYFAFKGKAAPEPMKMMKIENTKQDQKEMEVFLKEPANPKVVRAMRHKLMAANLDPKAPLMLGKTDTEVLMTVEDVLEEMAVIASLYNIPTDKLVSTITQVYDKMYDYVGEAINEHPSDIGLITVYLANRTLQEFHEELREQPEQA